MRYLLFILVVFLQLSCQQNNGDFDEVILDNDVINTPFVESLNEAEKTLLSWYLYAYGNECKNDSEKIKCKLLKILKIEDECSPDHLNNLLQWFSKDMMAVYKLNKCPNMPYKSAIQNTIEKIHLSRKKDTLTISIHVKGLNNSQEKNWDIEQTDSYLIEKSTFIKL